MSEKRDRIVIRVTAVVLWLLILAFFACKITGYDPVVIP